MRITGLMPAAALTAIAFAGTPATSRPVDPLSFFSGRTVGTGVLKVIFRKRETTHVVGTGSVSGNELVLRQIVRVGGDAPRTREWRIGRDGASHIAGTLTDASGPVTGSIGANRLVLDYPMKGGLQVHQVIRFRPDGQSADNQMEIRKFGIEVSHLDEIIRREPA